MRRIHKYTYIYIWIIYLISMEAPFASILSGISPAQRRTLCFDTGV